MQEHICFHSCVDYLLHIINLRAEEGRVYVGFVVDKVALGQVSLQVLLSVTVPLVRGHALTYCLVGP